MAKIEIKTCEREIEIKNKMGIHARPASLLVQITNKYMSDIVIEKDGMTVNAKSILGIMTLAAPFGAKLLFRATGPDAEEALQKINELFDNKFNED